MPLNVTTSSFRCLTRKNVKRGKRNSNRSYRMKTHIIASACLMDRRIEEKTVTGFAVVMFDLNDLKEINDSLGHEVGDQYIKDACKTICTQFKHSPVYRIGGDEFVAVLEGADYEKRDDLLAVFEKQMDVNLAQGKITIASGCACFDPSLDNSAHRVLERADEKMYQRKKQMKGATR